MFQTPMNSSQKLNRTFNQYYYIIMSKAKLLHFLLVLLITYSGICKAKRTVVHRCDVFASCGHIRNISYPFRLQGQPEDCGEKKYQLFCENNKTAIFFQNTKHYVLSINRANFTIRLVDAVVQKDNCSSVPLHSVNASIFNTAFPYRRIESVLKDQIFYVDDYSNHKIVLLSCKKPLTNSSLFIDTKSCANGSHLLAAEKKPGRHNYSYVASNDATVSDLAESCSVELMGISAKSCTGPNCTYSEIHDMIAYGFEASWKVIACEKYCKGRGFCYLDKGGDVISACAGRCDFTCKCFFFFFNFFHIFFSLKSQMIF